MKDYGVYCYRRRDAKERAAEKGEILRTSRAAAAEKRLLSPPPLTRYCTKETYTANDNIIIDLAERNWKNNGRRGAGERSFRRKFFGPTKTHDRRGRATRGRGLSRRHCVPIRPSTPSYWPFRSSRAGVNRKSPFLRRKRTPPLPPTRHERAQVYSSS